MKPTPRAASRAVLCLVLGLLHSGAAVCVWTGAISPYWSNPANWTNGIAPQLGEGDSLIFPENAGVRSTINDLPLVSTLPDIDISGIVIEGRNYTLAGRRINLEGNITSTPSLSTNHILLDLSILANVTIANGGYFNELELGGNLWMNNNSLVLETISDIVLSGRIDDAYRNGIFFRSPSNGRLTVMDRATIDGWLFVDHGTVTFANGSNGGKLADLPAPSQSRLIIGNDTDSPGASEVRLFKSNLIDPNIPIVINHSGVLNFRSDFYPSGIVQTSPAINGSGVLELDNCTLTIDPNGQTSRFDGEIQGTGTLQIGQPTVPSGNGTAGYFEIAGDPTLAAPVNVGAAELRLTGSLSNSVVSLGTGGVLSGNGIAEGIVSTGGIIRPGPGALRVLDQCSLDHWSQVWFHLDGPQAGSIETSSLDLGNAYLVLSFDGNQPDQAITLIKAGTATASVFRQDFHDWPEGSWILAGDPASEFQISYHGNAGHDVVLANGAPFVPPKLRIRPYSNSEQIIEWPLSAHDFLLQRTSLDYLGGWTTNGLPAADTNATDHFVIETNAVSWRFFRLIR